jgi:hypothetical protein
MHQTEETETHTTPKVSESYTKQSINEAFFKKTKTKLEASSLRNLHIIPRNHNPFALS